MSRSLTRILPFDSHILDNRRGRPSLAQRDELLEAFVRPCRNRLDPIVGKVTHPTGQPKLTGTIMDKETESHTLDPTTEDDVDLLIHRLALLHQISRPRESPPLAGARETLHVT